MTRPGRIFLRVFALAWALPTTIVGSLLLGLAVVTGGRASLVEGVLEAQGEWVRRALERFPVGHGGVAAVTLGHVVLGTDPGALASTRAHERAHVAQCERWGPFFLPAYAVASLWAVLRGVDAYRGNWFEREACAVAEHAGGSSNRRADRGAGGRST